MRKLIIAALFIVALGCFGASAALADCGCGSKCKQDTCTTCKQDCGSCKAKCDQCKPKCEPCKAKCEPCKPKCDPCKTKCNKCKQDTCTGGCKPACDKPKCDSCKPKCDTCKPKCNTCKQDCWGGQGQWVGNFDACCPPEAQVVKTCPGGCNSCARHPYEECWNGSAMLCDTGACGTYLPAKRVCETCVTTCKEIETTDPCDPCGKHVEYVYETVCTAVERPTVIPWWFNEKGDGNIYLDENGNPIVSENSDPACCKP